MTFNKTTSTYSSLNKVSKPRGHKVRGKNNIIQSIKNYQGDKLVDTDGNKYTGPIMRDSRGKYITNDPANLNEGNKLLNKTTLKRKTYKTLKRKTINRRY